MKCVALADDQTVRGSGDDNTEVWESVLVPLCMPPYTCLGAIKAGVGAASPAVLPYVQGP